MRIAIASDHAGYEYKEAIKAFLDGRGYEPVAFGAESAASCGYAGFIRPAAEAVGSGDCERGIVLGGSGNGEAIVANRVAGVRCALCWSHESAEMGRRHNDANVISIGQRMVTLESALDIVATWLDTPFDGGRHARRVAQID
ncbi:MAG: RpiB/LacA/LacB family sugar-phosphate isomerase [Dehalococcoidia bacterium]|nr:RpiB/LacA/LacB family sugar-phosphate isomerase [Dehalococcoidia bacterium]